MAVLSYVCFLVNLIRVICRVFPTRRGCRNLEGGMRHALFRVLLRPSDAIFARSSTSICCDRIYTVRVDEDLRVIEVGDNANGVLRVKDGTFNVQVRFASRHVSVFSLVSHRRASTSFYRGLARLYCLVDMHGYSLFRYERIQLFVACSHVAACILRCVFSAARDFPVLLCPFSAFRWGFP